MYMLLTGFNDQKIAINKSKVHALVPYPTLDQLFRTKVYTGPNEYDYFAVQETLDEVLKLLTINC